MIRTIITRVLVTLAALGTILGLGVVNAGSASAVTLEPFCKNFTSFSNQQQSCQTSINFAAASRVTLSPMTARGIVTQQQYYCNDRARGVTHEEALRSVKNRIGGVVQRAWAIGVGANSVSCRIF